MPRDRRSIEQQVEHKSKQQGRFRHPDAASSDGYEAVGLVGLDLDGVTWDIEKSISELFRELAKKKGLTQSDADDMYWAWQAEHHRRVLNNDPTKKHKSQVFLEWIIESNRPGGVLEGASPKDMNAVATRLFYQQLLDALIEAGKQTHKDTDGRGCLVIALDTSGWGPPAQAALAKELRGRKGLHVLLHSNRAVYYETADDKRHEHQERGWHTVGPLVEEKSKGKWLASIYQALVDHMGLPEGNIIAVGDSPRDGRMFLAALVAGGDALPVDLGDGTENLVKELAKLFDETGKDFEGSRARIHTVAGYDTKSGLPLALRGVLSDVGQAVQKAAGWMTASFLGKEPVQAPQTLSFTQQL